MEENRKILDSNGIKQEPAAMENFTFSRLESSYVYILLALGFCFIRFVVSNTTGFITTIFFMGTAFACLLYLKKSNYRLYKNHILMFCLVLLFSLVFSITANDFIKFLNIIFLLLSGIYWVYSVCSENRKIERYFFFHMLKAVFVMPFASFVKPLQILTSTSKQSKFAYNIKLALLGLVVTIPFTLIITSLLTRVDSGVEVLLTAVFGNISEFIIILAIQFIIGIPVAFYLFGLLYSNTNKLKAEVLPDAECEKTIERARLFPNLVMYSAVTPICILYTMFFALQLRYFTSAFNGILPGAYSYAEYARKGFFELFAIAVINLIIILIINFLSKQSGEKKPAALKVYSVLLSVFTILLIATAISKMIMYIGNYGLTQLRVYTTWFMVLLTVIFVMIIIKQFKYNFNFVKHTVAAFVLLFGVLCFSNVDGHIAEFNIEMYQAGYFNELDVAALCNLSDDGLVYVLKDGIDTQDYLQWKLESYNHYSYDTYNLSSLKVKKLLESK